MHKIVLLTAFLFGFSVVQAQIENTYVASPETDSVLAIDLESDEIVATIELDSRPGMVTTDPAVGRVYVTTDDGVTIINAATNTIIDNLILPDRPIGLNVMDNQFSVLLSGGQTMVFNAETLEHQATDIPVRDAAQRRQRRPIPLFLPASPLCPLNAGAPRAVFQTNLPPGLIDMQCRILAVNGEYLQNPGEIGIQEIIDLGVIHAVEVFSPSDATMTGIDVCLLGRGQVIFLDAEDQPREPQFMRPTHRMSYQCIQLPGAGTVILVE